MLLSYNLNPSLSKVAHQNLESVYDSLGVGQTPILVSLGVVVGYVVICACAQVNFLRCHTVAGFSFHRVALGVYQYNATVDGRVLRKGIIQVSVER